jgi:hypothetical protein
MNSLLRVTAATAAAAVTSATLNAQTLNITSPNYSGTKLFESTPGFNITGLGVSGSGEIYYIESEGAFPATVNAHLYKRSPSDGYVSSTTLFDFGSPVFGSFVVFNGGKVYFGESSTGAIRSINPDGTGLDALGTVADNYDLAFSGGSLFFSHNPGGFSAQGKVSKFDLVADGTGGLMLSGADLILDTPTDYSGPVEFGLAGSFFYGGTAASGGTPNLFRFSGAEILAANGGGPTLTLDNPHLFLANGANAGLAFDGANGLWHTKSGVLDIIDTDTATSTPVGTTSNFLGQIDYAFGTVYAGVTDFASNRSAVFAVVPEPNCAIIAILGLALSEARRRRR